MTTENLDDIAREFSGAAVPNQAPGAAGASPLPGGFDFAAESRAWAEIPSVFGSLLAMAMPELSAVYTPAACLQWGEKMTAVGQKYGWSATLIGPELALAIASLGLLAPTYAAIKLRRDPAAAAALAAALKAAGDGGNVTGPGTVTGAESPPDVSKPAKVKPLEEAK